MTLCKFRPRRTYDAQFIVEKFDADGLRKVLGERIGELGDAGDAMTPYYVGAQLALSTLLDVAEAAGEVDRQTDFMRLFERALEDLR